MKNLGFMKRVRFAFAGGWFALKREKSFRTQFVFAAGAFAVLICVRPHPIWWALFIVVAGMVLATELINTAIETAIDRLHPEIHPHIGIAKDCLAAAVLVCSLSSVGVFMAFLAAHLRP